MIPLLATVAAALLMWAAFPPLNLGFLVFVAPAPYLWALRQTEKPGQAAWLGFVFGALFYGATMRWVGLLGIVALVPLTLAWAMYTTVFALALWATRFLPPTRAWVAMIGIWAFFEFSRARWPFGGLPWADLGSGVGVLAWPRGAAQWIGASGWSVVAIAVAATIALVAGGAWARLPLQASLGTVAVLTVLGAIFAPTADGDPFQVAIVQGGSPCPRVHCPNENALILQSHLELTRQIGPGVDLVVWPENATGDSTSPVKNPEVFAEVSGLARDLETYFIVSGTRVAEDPSMFINANLVFNRRGDLLGEYRKRHPVPFGEYVPFRDQLEFIPQLDAVPRDMVRGTQAVVFDLPEGVLGTVISFEGAFARSVRSIVREGAELLVVTSNEGSYGRTEASDQFLALTRMRAAEMGTPLIHSAITGRSTIVGADGSIGETTGLFLPQVLTGEVRWRTAGPTLYARLGDWLALAAMVAALAAFAWRRERRTPALFTPPWARPAP